MPPTMSVPRMDIDRAADLRRHRPADLARTIAERAEWCLPDDRALVQAMYQQGLSAAQIAQLRDAPVQLVRRRIKSVVRRVLSPRYLFVLRHRDAWSPSRRRVATACVLQGRTLRQTARHLQVSLYTVRRQMDAVSALFEAHCDLAGPPNNGGQRA